MLIINDFSKFPEIDEDQFISMANSKFTFSRNLIAKLISEYLANNNLHETLSDQCSKSPQKV